jgi:hypothetical protein
MNPIFSFFHVTSNSRSTVTNRIASTLAVLLLVLMPATMHLRAQSGSGDPNAEFKRLVGSLSAARLNGTVESESQQEKSLTFLDSIAFSILNGSAAPDLGVANQRLAGLVSSNPPIGENYRLIKLGGSPSMYALIVNFGLGGPAAVRIYSPIGGRYALASKIDHFSQKDFFDSDVELVPVSDSAPVFVTVSGRTDDLSTGLFSAWRIDGQRAVALWTSDLLQQSNYEADANGFRLTYCGQPDEDHPSKCLKMTRDVYRFEAGEWKRVESVDLPPVKPSQK